MAPPLIIVIANRKGGSGKTTTAVNLASEWSARGKRTLLIDLDNQGHAGIGLGYKTARYDGHSSHRIFWDNFFNLRDSVLLSYWPNLSFIPADLNFDGTGTRDPLILRRQLEDPFFQANFDRIILDTPPTLDVILINAIAASWGILVPFLPHHLAAVGVLQLSKLYYQAASKLNSTIKLFCLIPVMQDLRANLTKEVIHFLARQFGEKRILNGIRSNIRLAEAFAYGQPINRYAPKSTGAHDYKQLADDLETRLPFR